MSRAKPRSRKEDLEGMASDFRNFVFLRVLAALRAARISLLFSSLKSEI